MKIFDFEDILLLPERCVVSSRSQCDTSQKLGKHTFKLPVMPANMKTILDEELAIELAKNGYFYVMHRFDFDSFEFTKRCKEEGVVSSISLGIKEEDYELVNKFASEGVTPDYITIDIAHGHANSVKELIKYIKERLDTFVIAGNVSTPNAVRDLEMWGADATKVGVGPGKVCITKLKTGFGSGGWQLACVNWCSKAARKPIIVDGGLRENGDIAKSIRFGGDFVMIGSMFAGHIQSPGKTIEENGKVFKEYYGSASEHNKGEYKHVEGKKILVEAKGDIFDTLVEMQQDLQSSISYAGGTKLSDIRNVDYVILNK